MQNARTETVGRAAGLFGGLRSPFWAFAVAGALIACGKSNPPPGPGSPSLQSIALSPATVELSTGAQQQLTVTGTYSDSTTAEVTSGIDWSSSNPSVARMNGPGLVLATSDSTNAGTTTITASVGALSARATVGVKAATLLSISVAPATASVPVPVLQPFTAIGHFSDGTTAPLVNVAWSCSDGAVATIDDSGFAWGLKTGGPVTITASTGGFTATASLTITDPVLVSIAVTPNAGSVPAGYDRRLKVNGRYSDGTSRDHSAGATWSSSSEAVATVDATGLAHGVAPGGASITATYQGLSSAASLTVTAPLNTAVVPAHVDDAMIDASGSSYYRVTGLNSAIEYMVRVSTAALDRTSVQVEVDVDASFTSMVCRSWAGGPPCRAGYPSTGGDLFVLVTAPAGTTFTLDASPLPVLQAGQTVTGSTETETYFKVERLAPAASVQASLSGLTDTFADLFVYGGPQGPLGPGSASLCSTVLAGAEPKSCAGAGLVPADGTVYVTVEAWLTGMAEVSPPGTAFSATF